MKKYVAEFVGTLGLTLAVLISLGGGVAVATPIIAALTLGLFVYSIGGISGTHINPAVTIALLSLRKISPIDAGIYIVAQFLGAGAALMIAGAMVDATTLIVLDTLPIFFAELIGTFFFAFGIASVVYGKTPSSMSGIVIGGSLLLGILIASVVSNGVLNPAVAFGIGSFSWVYVLGPMVGALLGMWSFAYLAGERMDI